VHAERGQLDLRVLLGVKAAAEEHIHLRSDHHGGSTNENGEHEHNHEAFDSLVIELPAIDRERLLAGLQALLERQVIYRVKGFAALPDKPMRLVIQGVGRRFETYFDRHWRDGESRGTTLVVIGQGLDRQTVSEALTVAAAAR
ncbi:MAG: GTP-binding protein, partial [Gammaproteobacteria bacterium]|nr:GTP-binding protein [Gammaproteobacteria bacterium]